MILCGFSAILGHAFPVFLRFRGGKAVATCFGVFIWLCAYSCRNIVWRMGYNRILVTRYVSLGSMIGTLALVGVLVLVVDSPFGDNIYLTLLSVAVTILVIAKHTSNIKRIISGTEKKVFAKKAD